MAVPPDFTAGSVLTAAQMNKVGMWLVKTATMNGTSVNVNDCFSSDYTNYRVIVSNIKASASGATTALNMRMRVSGADDTGNNYSWAYVGNSQTGTGLDTSNQNQSQASTGLDFDTLNLVLGGLSFDVYAPNEAVRTLWSGSCVSYFAGSSIFAYSRTGMMWHNLTTAYTGFTLRSDYTYQANIYVYGYNNG